MTPTIFAKSVLIKVEVETVCLALRKKKKFSVPA